MLAILLLAILAQSVHALEFGYEYGYYKVLTDSTVSLSTITVYRPTNFVVPEKVVDYSGKSYTVVEIGSGVAYLNEENLSGITIPGTVKRISDGAFSECGSLGNVYLSEGLESIGDNAFEFCNNIPYIEFPSTLKSIGKESFNNCTSIKSITLPANLNNIGQGAFFNCTNLKKITVNPENKYFSVDNGILYNFDKTRLLCHFTNALDETFQIPSTVKEIDAFAFWADYNVTEIVIPVNVTLVSPGAFANMGKLTKFTVEDSNTSYKAINNVLYSKDNTTLVAYPTGIDTLKLDTSASKIGAWAFAGNQRISELPIPDNYTEIGEAAFFFCPNLNNFTINENIKKIGKNIFAQCYRLSSIDIKSRHITEIPDGAFRYCEALVSFNTPASITKLGNNAFNGCNLLKNITLPNSLIEIGNSAFLGCNNLYSIIFPPSLKSIGDRAFSMCRIKDITFPDSLETIGAGAFGQNTAVQSLVFPATLTLLGTGAFHDCTSLRTVSFNDSPVEIQETAFQGCTEITSFNLGRKARYIGKSALSSSQKLTTFDFCNAPVKVGLCLPGSVKTVENVAGVVELEDYAFGYLENKSFNMPNLVAIGKNAFEECTNLETVIFSDSLEYIGYEPFDGCRSLKNIKIGKGLKHIGYRAFYEINANPFSIEAPYLSEIEPYAFMGSSISSVVLGDKISQIPRYCFYGSTISSLTGGKNLRRIDTNAFNECKSLKEIDLRNVAVIDTSAFSYCESLQEIALSDSLHVIRLGAFSQCNSLEKVIIPDNVDTVENAAFEYCTNLTYIELGKSLKYVGPYAFYGNYQSLKMIVSKNPVPPTVGKNEVFSNYADATLYVPKGSVESYRNAPEWNKFLKIEEINPAGIDDITTSNSTSDAPCYDLQGRNIPYPLKGIYIQNGKKFIAK